jgi:hypothetical protein
VTVRLGEGRTAHEGKVDFMDNRVDPRTGTIQMRAVLANKDRTLLPGLLARVRLTAGPPRKAVLIPAAAVLGAGGDAHVLVVKDGAARKQAVKLGRREGGLYEVEEGLKAGDRVVVEGAKDLEPGKEAVPKRTAPPVAKLPPVKVARGPGPAPALPPGRRWRSPRPTPVPVPASSNRRWRCRSPGSCVAWKGWRNNCSTAEAGRCA